MEEEDEDKLFTKRISGTIIFMDCIINVLTYIIRPFWWCDHLCSPRV
jgi:hypothetical protein